MTPKDVNPVSEKIMRKQQASCPFPIQLDAARRSTQRTKPDRVPL